MTMHHRIDVGASVVAILDIGGLDRPFIRVGTSGVVEERSPAGTSLVRFGDHVVDVDDDEIAAADADDADDAHAPSPAAVTA